MSDTKPRRQPITMFGLGQRCCDWRLQPETTFCGTFTTSDADVELLREIDMAGNQALYGVGVPASRPVRRRRNLRSAQLEKRQGGASNGKTRPR